MRHSLSFISSLPTDRKCPSSQAPPESGQRKGIPHLHRPEEMVPGQQSTQMGLRTALPIQTCPPSACILTRHPVILPIPYLVFSHLVERTACILCFILHSIPCTVVCMFVYAWGLIRLNSCGFRSLSSMCTSTKTLKEELNGLKQSERRILE